MSTPKKTKPWARLSFDGVQDALREGQETENFRCIAKPRGQPCQDIVEATQVSYAIDILRSCGNEAPTVENVRDIIYCLICEKHSQYPTHLKNIEEAWKERFEPQFFDGRRSPSPYSLDRHRKTSIRARTPLTPESERGGPRACHGSAPRILLTPDDTPAGRLQRSASAPESPTLPEPNRPSAVDPFRVSDNDEQDSNDSDPPTAARGCQVDGEEPEHDLIQDEDDVGQPATTSGQSCPVDDVAMPTEAAPRGRRAPGPSDHDDGFHRGIAYNWAPWTIRSKVIELLQEPLPGPKTMGRLYVARVLTGDDQRYVKIGITARKNRKARFDEIKTQHGVTLEVGSVRETEPLPMAQVMRLEALVHADLAFFQRNLRVVKGKRTTYHVEYFRISLHEAWNTVDLWRGIVQEMELDKDLDQEVVQSVRRCSDVLDTEELDDRKAELEQWVQLNADHKHRYNIWSAIPRKTPFHGMWQTSVAAVRTIVWLCAMGFTALVLEALLILALLGWQAAREA